MKAPITDSTLGIVPDHSGKFREVRDRARDEYAERGKRKKRDATVAVPKHKPGDVVVMLTKNGARTYLLAEIVDFEGGRGYDNGFTYYAVILKSTGSQDRIGRLIKTGYFSGRIENIPPDSIKWPEVKDEQV